LLPSDREGIGISTSNALGIDAEGELLKIFGNGGDFVGHGDDFTLSEEEGTRWSLSSPTPPLRIVQAAELGDFEIITKQLTGVERDGLIAQGCVNARLGAAQMSALHYAARKGAMSTVILLLEAGADPRAACSPPSLLTPLHAAADATLGEHSEEELEGVVTALCEAGGDVNAREGEFQQTPLHLAALRGHGLVVRALLQHGADSGALDRFGDAPYDLAIDGGFKEIAGFFR